MKNHLVIGLGGTGGKILRALRKNVFQEWRGGEPDQVRLRYLYVDSSKEMMAIDDATWRILGESVQLATRSQLLITGGNLNQILDNISGHPNIQPWIGSRDQWKDILNSIVGETLGGQKRRLGRFLFACKARQFKDQIKQLAGELTTGGDASVTFHLCCGLAGGTGSGAVIDAVAQIRALYRDPKMYRIVVYALLPEEIPNPNWDTGNYHANGYAALVELNALSVGAYQPHDLAERGERLALSDPFNGCYIFCNRNENGLQVDVDKTLPGILADFLFQKLMAVRNAEAMKLLEKMENAENGDGTPETRTGGTTPLRSKRFLTFGIKRLAVPEGEIREYLTYQFARQAALQLRYNNWDDTFGFRDEPRNQDFGEFVRDQQTLERWSLTDEHLTLSRGILPEEINNKKWKPIVKEWLDLLPQLMGLVQTLDDEVWINEIDKLMAQGFDDNFRGLGVRKFYETKLQARKDHVRELRRRVEGELFDEWKNGVKSMHDIARCLSALSAALQERLVASDDRISRAKSVSADAEQKVAANRVAYANVGLVSQLLGKRRGLLDAEGEALRELYTARTQVEAWAYAKRLLQEAISEFNALASDVAACTRLVDDSIKEFQERIDARCNDGATPDLRQPLVRFYNAENVRLFGRELEKDRGEQTRQAQAVRVALIEQFAADPTFSAFQARISRQRFFDVLEQQCAASSQSAHDALVSSNRERRPLLGVNIIGQLEREYSGRTDELKKFIHDLVNQAGNFLEFDPQAVVLGAAKTKVSQFLVILPKAPDLAQFGEALEALFRDNFRGDVPVDIIRSETNLNEITLLGLTNLFPLRYAKATRFLKEQYERRIAQGGNPERIRLELNGEGDGTQWPAILLADERAQRDQALPALLLAKALGLIAAVTSPTTGISELYLIGEDAEGLPVRTRLGKGLPEVFEGIDLTAAQGLVDAVQARLSQDAFRHVDQRTALQAAVRDELKGVLAERRNDFEDPVYRRFETAARAAIQALKND
ncbi:tubulin-like doman-containing protein [uncultured Thiodictyon sp.]|uniref:tubulin-like doman-containing protein n=1 Tax=uncultured Thiodictyon sp. TaxID=1846217 RepID=UPI0025EDCD8D|nr:tubulin-like doman-containing protein [uncultured Thiodictyon sp.]